MYIGFEIGIRKMHPNSIKANYLGAISNGFILQGIENLFEIASKQKIIKIVLEGYLRIYYKANPKSGSRKVAFTIELVKYVDVALKSWKLVKHAFVAIKLALKFGIYFLLRKSEFIPSGSKKGICWNQIDFYDNKGDKISWNEINIENVKTVTINIPFSKTDPYGMGRIITHTKMEEGCCIVHDLVEWVHLCKNELKHNYSSHVFMYENNSCIVNDTLIMKAMKTIAIYLGWKPDKVSMHSLRYGGATMLAAAGLPQYIIEYFGGWATDSKALKETYIKIAAKGASQVSTIFNNGYLMSLEETKIREAQLI